MDPKRSSLQAFRLKRVLDSLASKEGRGTELVSLYVPPGRQVSEVLAMLREEYGTASNIKSDATRKNVQDAITKVSQRLKLFKQIPKNGLVIFCGAIPQNGPGSERIEIYVVIPPEPINVYLYRCDAKFKTEHLQDLLKEKETYGILVIDSSAATLATLRGRRLEVKEDLTSGIPGKHRAGGQSAARFQRLREAKLSSYFKRVGKHADEVFLKIPNLKGLIIGGPGPTKQDFTKGDYMQYTLKDKIVATIDTAYVGDQGVKEVMEKSPKILKSVRYVEEKRVVQDFLYEIGQDTGLATYGEKDVRRNMEAGAVKTLLLSEDLDAAQVAVNCTTCDYIEHKTLKRQTLSDFKESVTKKPCPKCAMTTLHVAEIEDLVDSLAGLAEQFGSDVEIISTETEEGVMLRDSFGGIAATLRFKL